MENENNNEQNQSIESQKSDNENIQQNKNEIVETNDEAWFFRTRNIIYYVLGVIEVLLAFRLIFRSLGASTRNGMVALLYSITKALIMPFSGIFNIINPNGAGQYVIEPAAVIAMVVYALLAYGLVKLIKVTAVSV